MQLSHEAVWLRTCSLSQNALQEEEVRQGNGSREDGYRGQLLSRFVIPWQLARVQGDPCEGQTRWEENAWEHPRWERELVHEGS